MAIRPAWLLAAGLASWSLPTPAHAADNDRACTVARSFQNPKLLHAMQRGVNLPGWDDEEKSGRPTVAQLQSLRDRGITHVRLLLDERRLEEPGRGVYLDQMFEQIILLFSLDYAVSLDLHAGSIFARKADAEGYLNEVWQAIAARIRFLDPTMLAVELLNEPQTNSATWWPVAERLAASIRNILPSTTIVVGPAGPQRHEELSGLRPFADPNVVYAIHYYDPFVFTHQGADWGGVDDPIRYLGGLPFPADASDTIIHNKLSELESAGHAKAAATLRRSLGTPWTEEAMAPAFDMMADWSTSNARPVIVNEFGVLSYHAPRQSRLDWLATVRKLAEERCIGWTHWDFQDGFGLMNPETGMPDVGVMDALVPLQ